MNECDSKMIDPKEWRRDSIIMGLKHIFKEQRTKIVKSSKVKKETWNQAKNKKNRSNFLNSIKKIA